MDFSYTYMSTMRGLVSETRVADRVSVSFHSIFTNTYHRFWFSVVHQKDRIIEVPLVLMPMIESHLCLNSCEEIIAPILEGPNPITSSGAETILKKFSEVSFQYGLLKVTTPKNEIYYGCKGLILDSRFHPIFMPVIKGKFTDMGFTVIDKAIYIDPSVFCDDNATINKSLARKGVPFYLSGDVTTRFERYQYISGSLPPRWSILIDNPNKFIHTPVEIASTDVNEEINTFLWKNMDKVMNHIKRSI